MDFSNDQRLIEAGFPCHQVGAETQRERGASSALPPLYYLHVWWARRPLTPSRAAILASLLPADADPEQFVKGLGVRILVANVHDGYWVLGEDKIRKRIVNIGGSLKLEVDAVVLRAYEREQNIREENRKQIGTLIDKDATLNDDPVIVAWKNESIELPSVREGEILDVSEAMGDPAWAKEKMAFTKQHGIRFSGDAYNYPRAFSQPVVPVDKNDQKVILDPTSGGGSIPFEALRLGHKVIANELNPVASVILKATIDYPCKFGKSLLGDLEFYAEKILCKVEYRLAPYFALGQLVNDIGQHEINLPGQLSQEEMAKCNSEDIVDFLYCRQVTCPHCAGDAPLLNSLWLSKEGNKWGVAIKPQPDKTVHFEPFEITAGNRGPNGEDLDAGTVTNAVGQCVHCHQAISGDEIKSQARGESELGKWKDVLYCVVGIRIEPKLDKHGKVQRFASGERKGEIKTGKVRYFRAANQKDLEALHAAEQELEERRLEFEMKGLMPNGLIPPGSKTSEPLRYGMNCWEDLFTPRQLLGHLSVMEALQEAKPEILSEFGEDKGRALITYLQFAIDKIVDYNSRQTRWISQRGTISGTFSRHDFSLKWTFGEMVYAGPSSGFRWGLSQAMAAYKGIEELVEERGKLDLKENDITQTQGSATEMPDVADNSVDAVVMDPPYYDNVQYSELSDFYYVWQKKTLGDLYPGWFDHEVTDKALEAVANPARDGSAKGAKARYEELMQGIFAESKRVLKPDGIMTLMFTHKSSDAWETLTNSLIQSGWDITATYPVDSEFGASTHQLNLAAAASTIFIACRPADRGNREPSSWAYEVKGKLEAAVREGLGEFERLKLNPVDRMIASWGRALRVYSAHWPVQDGDDEVPPTRAMQEAARVVAEEEVSRLSGGLVTVDDLDAESRLAVIALGINGLGDFAFDDALQMSRSLNFRLQNRNGNYRVSDDMVAYANVGEDERAAPLAIKGNKLRLLKPEERASARLENPQTLWDVLGGLIMTHREGGIVAARNYLSEHGKRDSDALRGLLKVWAKECRDDELKREAQLIDYEL
ncbi:DUF1156 domain-containing protein [Halomonas sp. H10-9-1]|uniref:DUF1156 domain-containing protein n=1 Tax=Halomonas sp. H10-9-1 TaxID=2950871 RepID=UPI0032DEDEC8